VARVKRNDSFTDFVLDQLSGLGQVEARSLFGGKGLYWKDAIFGLIDEGRLYFRVSPENAVRYATEGRRPFDPGPGHVMNGYFEVPARVLEDPEAIAAWAREAWALPRSKPMRGSLRRKPHPRARRHAGRRRR